MSAIKKYEELLFSDDFMFCKIMANHLDLCKEVVEIVLNRKIEIIAQAEKQASVEITPDGKGIRMDVKVIGDDTVFNLEMQKSPKTGITKRARYYQGLLDLDMLERGDEYDKLKDSVIIFICTFDPFGKGLARYTVRQCIAEDSEMEYNDGTGKVFLSTLPDTKGELTQELRAFLNYVNGALPENDFTRRLDQAVEDAKSQRRWRKEYMLLEEKFREYEEIGIEKGEKIGEKIGQKKGRVETNNELQIALDYLRKHDRENEVSKLIEDLDFRTSILEEIQAEK